MKEEIAALINEYAKTSISIREVAKQILNQFASDSLFEILCDYLENLPIARYEWSVTATALCLVDRNRANQHFTDLLLVDDTEKQYRLIKLLSLYGTEFVVPN